jgi:TPR repeat protein
VVWYLAAVDGAGRAEHDFVERLRALGALHRDVLKRQPSVRFIARAVGISPTTLGKWLEGAQVPQQPDRLVAAVEAIRAEAKRAGKIDQDPLRVLDGAVWLDKHRQVLLERAMATGRLVEGSNATSEIIRQHRINAGDLADPPRPVNDWTPAQLGVHPAIAGTLAASTDFVLPRYIPRAHDEHLRDKMRSAAISQKVEIVVLRGESCTGKTRSAYEAIKACFPDWRLAFPKDPESLRALLLSGSISANTVLWLNEAQNYLLGSDGESCAAALRRRLEGEGPSVIVLTLWPEYYRALISEEIGGSTAGGPQARALISQASLHVVQNHLNDVELMAVQSGPGRNPSLEAAYQAASSSGKLIQVLAAGPDLVDHYEHPAMPIGCYGKSLISAAIDARRLGVDGPLSLDFLVEAAPGYLSDAQRAEAPPDWVDRAIKYAHLKVKNVASAFTLVPREKGIGPEPGVVNLADYLHFYGRMARALLCPPDSFWEAARSDISTAKHIQHLAVAAMHRLRVRHGLALAEIAAMHGETEALWEIASQSAELGNHEESARMFLRLAEGGEPEAFISLAADKEDMGLREEARMLYTRAADAGHLDGLREWADSEAINDREESAIWIYRLLVSRGDKECYFRLGGVLESIDDLTEAEVFYRKAVAEGSARAAQRLANLLDASGQVEAAAELRPSKSEFCETSHLLEAMLTYESHSRKEDAESIFWDFIESGNESLAVHLPWYRVAQGDISGAKAIAMKAAGMGFLESLSYVATQCMRQHEEEEVELLLAELARYGKSPNSGDYALYLERRNECERAELIAAEDERMENFTLLEIAQYRAGHGDIDSARELANRVLRRGESFALSRLVEIEESVGNYCEAERLAFVAVDAGDFRPLKRLAEKHPENDTFVHILRSGL